MRARRDMLGPRLFTPPPADEATLSDRQAYALQQLRQHPEGLSGEQLGRLVHDHLYETHSVTCPYCGKAGLSVLRQLKSLGLVAQRRAGRWQAVGARGLPGSLPPADDSVDPRTDPIPW